MDGATIQAKAYYGYSKVAQKAGLPYQQFRANSVSNPTDPARLVQTLPAFFSADADFLKLAPPVVGKNAWFVALDGTQTQPGDYLIGAAGDTWFVSTQYAVKAIGVVQCNGSLSVLRPTGNPGFGAQPYGGDAVSAETPIMTNWPSSILQGTKGERGDSTLPGDVRMPWYAVQFPAFGNVQVMASDVLNDNLGRRYKVSSCELVSSTWRLTAILAET